MSKKLTIVEAARNYADAEPSDPFLRYRIAAHMKNGVADGENGYYAEPRQVEREYRGIDGERKTYIATEYHSRRRP